MKVFKGSSDWRKEDFPKLFYKTIFRKSGCFEKVAALKKQSTENSAYSKSSCYTVLCVTN